MISKPLTIVVAFLVMTTAISGGEPRPPLTVTYVANEGFIVECRDDKIAIDALFGGRKSDEFVMPSDSLIELMKTATPPFDSIDVILVTHFHGDHFESGIMVSHLRHDPRTVLVCPPQVAERMAKIDGYSDISDRIHVISAPVDSVVTVDIGGLDIKAIPGKHGKYVETDEATGEDIDRHRDVQHLEYVISMYGRRIYHGGDGPLNDMERYPRLGLGDDVIDLAFVPWFTPRKMIAFREKLVRKVMKGQTIILMHLWPNRDFSGAEHKKVCAERNIIVPRTSMESWTIP